MGTYGWNFALDNEMRAEKITHETPRGPDTSTLF